MIRPEHHVPMVLNRAWVFANEVFSILCNRRGTSLDLSPRAGLTNSRDADIRLDTDETKTINQQRLNFCDLQFLILSHGNFFDIHCEKNLFHRPTTEIEVDRKCRTIRIHRREMMYLLIGPSKLEPTENGVYAIESYVA